MSCLDSDQGFCFINLDRKYTVLIFLDAKAPAEAQFSIKKGKIKVLYCSLMILVGAEFESNILPKGTIHPYFGSLLLYILAAYRSMTSLMQSESIFDS
jgi:hypothetical protein